MGKAPALYPDQEGNIGLTEEAACGGHNGRFEILLRQGVPEGISIVLVNYTEDELE